MEHDPNASLLLELAPFEEMLLWPAPGATPTQIESLLAPTFHEIGASGRRFDREFGIATLHERCGKEPASAWRMADRTVDRVTPDVVLHTYLLQRHDGPESRRATLWVRAGEGWSAVFHQGTPIASPAN